MEETMRILDPEYLTDCDVRANALTARLKADKLNGIQPELGPVVYYTCPNCQKRMDVWEFLQEHRASCQK